MAHDPHDAGADFLGLGPTPAKVARRSLSRDEEEDLDAVVASVQRATLGAGEVGDALIYVTRAARELLYSSGLGLDAICILIQEKAGFTGANRSKIPHKTIESVLKAAAALDEFLDKEAIIKRREQLAKKAGR